MATYLPMPGTPSDKYAIDENGILLDTLHNIPLAIDITLDDSDHLTKEIDTSLSSPSSSSLNQTSISNASSFQNAHNVHSKISIVKTALQGFCRESRGVFLVVFSQLFGALMNVTTRLLEIEGEGMHPFQILFARQGITSILCSLWMWWKSVPDFPLGKKGVRGLLCVRALSGFFGIFGIYYSLQYLPVADAVVITFLAPSVASYGCYLFLREPFPKSAQYASLISLIGVMLIAQPTSFFSSSTITPSPEASSISNSTSTIGITATSISVKTLRSVIQDIPIPTTPQRVSAIAVALLGVLGTAVAFTSIRYIGSSTHPLISVNYFSIFCTIISFSVLVFEIPYSPVFKLPDGARQWCMLLFLGGCGFVMQYLLTRGLSFVPESSEDEGVRSEGGNRKGGKRKGGGREVNMVYSNMVFAVVLDRWVFGVVPSWWSLAGSALILGCAVYIGFKKEEVVEGDALSEGDEEERVGILREEDGERERTS